MNNGCLHDKINTFAMFLVFQHIILAQLTSNYNAIFNVVAY